jgi:transketolase
VDDQELRRLKLKARDVRKAAIEAIGGLGVGHIGGCMSIVETLVILYHKFMKIDAANPRMPDRDKLILSKGHAGPTLYSILSDLGFFPREWLATLNRGGSRLPSHCDMNLTPGVDMTTGSLGHGLSAGVGMAIGHRMDGLRGRVYVVIGDGECNEGQVWEAAMAAAQFGLDTLTAFLDYNKMELDGTMEEIMDIADITAKWVSFNWFVQRIDGHDFAQLERAILRAQRERGRPSMIVLDTIKGKGCSFAENRVESHNMSFDIVKAREAIALLDAEEIDESAPGARR